MHLLALLILALTPIGPQTESLNMPSVWISQDTKWVRAPKDYNPNLSSGRATILYFRSDGKFGLLHCVLNRTDKYLVISAGDGYVVEDGTWIANGANLTIRKRLVYETGPKVGATYPGPQTLASARVSGKGAKAAIELDRRRFSPASDPMEFSPENLERWFFKSFN